MKYLLYGVLFLLIFGCGSKKESKKEIIIHSLDTLNSSNTDIMDAKIQIGSYTLVGGIIGANKESGESSLEYSIKLSEMKPILLNIKFKFQDKNMDEKIDITSKLIPFEGKRIAIKFGIYPESAPIINNLVITESKY